MTAVNTGREPVNTGSVYRPTAHCAIFDASGSSDVVIVMKNCTDVGLVDSSETSFLFQRLSVIIQRFDSALVMHFFCYTDKDPDL